MRRLVTLTHLLFPLFIGMIIGSVISGNTTMLIWGLILLVLDIFIGISMQHAVDKEAFNDEWNRLSSEEKRAVATILLEKVKKDMGYDGIDVDEDIKKFYDEFDRQHGLGKYSDYTFDDEESEEDDLCDKLDDIYLRLKAKGGARITNGIRGGDEAASFLLDVCRQMPHAPLRQTLWGLNIVSVEDLDGSPAIVYTFRYSPNSMCQNAFIFLVHSEIQKIRLFAVETHLSTFALCEYSGNRHLNYGSVELKNVPSRIKEILKKK